MYALVAEDLADADRWIARTGELAPAAAEPDVEAVIHHLAAARAERAGDVGELGREADAFVAYGSEHGMASVTAQGAQLWLLAGQPDRAEELARQLAGAGLDSVPGDVYFLLTVALLTGIAAELRIEDLAADGARLLEPYAGRAVLNAGAMFQGVVDEYVFRAYRALGRPEAARWRHSAQSCYERIGAAWWRGRLAAPGVHARESPVTIYLRRDEAGWTVGRDGATAVLPDVKGLHYIRYLLQRPGIAVEAADLAAAVAGHPGQAVREQDAELIDERALRAYRARLADLDAELDEAGRWHDEARAPRLELEREALLGEIAAATGFGGRRRQFSSSRERARVAVRKAIAGALKRIEHHDVAVARHLRDSVRTGAACSYDPDPARPVAWVL